MGTILSQEQINEIRAQIKVATDQIYVTPVKYYKEASSVDRWSEDRKDAKEAAIDLLGFLEYPDDLGQFGRETEAGIDLVAAIKVTLNMDDLEALGLVNPTNFAHTLKVGDSFETQGKMYRVVFVGYDGPIEQKFLLAIIVGEEREE